MGSPKIYCQKVKFDGTSVFQREKYVAPGYNPVCVASSNYEKLSLLSGPFKKKIKFLLINYNGNNLLEKDIVSGIKNVSWKFILFPVNDDLAVTFVKDKNIYLEKYSWNGEKKSRALRLAKRKAIIKDIASIGKPSGEITVGWIEYINKSEGNIFILRISDKGKILGKKPDFIVSFAAT